MCCALYRIGIRILKESISPRRWFLRINLKACPGPLELEPDYNIRNLPEGLGVLMGSWVDPLNRKAYLHRSAGNAWEIGVIAGLFDAGLDVTRADLTIGTSAGSTVAAQITSSTRPPKLFADILAATPQPGTGGVGSDRGGVPRPVANHMERTDAIFGAAADAADLRRRMGAAALEMDAAGTAPFRCGGAPPSPLDCLANNGPSDRYTSSLSMPIPVIVARPGNSM
jgi:hypothetical protein